jgi:TPP-dependent pyruvate/acetoin dehydrogenase alpha subunit
MLEEGLITETELETIDRENTAKIDKAVKFGDRSPYPPPEEALRDVWVRDDIEECYR